MKAFDESMSLDRNCGHIEHNREYKYFLGSVFTIHGIVAVYSQSDLSTLRFIWNGRLHIRTMRRGLTERGLITVAGRYAAEIAGNAARYARRLVNASEPMREQRAG